jgi:beta-galactosidase/beta-glucuronidase
MLQQVENRVIHERHSAVPGRTSVRPRVHGKFLYVGGEKLHVRGVTYGTSPDIQRMGTVSGGLDGVRRDFASMAANGVNAVRTYTVPPVWLLDEAAEFGLHVMVGLPWEQHVTFLDDASRVRDIRRRIREDVRQCANHPAVPAYAIGNEIPAPIVRWHGRDRVQTFLRSLYDCAKSEDPEGLATYVPFPTTEYLNLDVLDFVSFNVYLET